MFHIGMNVGIVPESGYVIPLLLPVFYGIGGAMGATTVN